MNWRPCDVSLKNMISVLTVHMYLTCTTISCFLIDCGPVWFSRRQSCWICWPVTSMSGLLTSLSRKDCVINDAIAILSHCTASQYRRYSVTRYALDSTGFYEIKLCLRCRRSVERLPRCSVLPSSLSVRRYELAVTAFAARRLCVSTDGVELTF